MIPEIFVVKQEDNNKYYGLHYDTLPRHVPYNKDNFEPKILNSWYR